MHPVGEDEVATTYRRFAQVEAVSESPSLSAWAAWLADDEQVVARLASLPRDRTQPNLVFAAARVLGADPFAGTVDLQRILQDRWDELVAIVTTRSTQTNEANRCATLLPHLADIDGPIALVEVGASAGLCLLPDRWSYRYDHNGDEHLLHPDDGPSPVVLACRSDTVPSRTPDITWRRGIDLNPLSVGDPDDLAWLEALVWPEHEDRRHRLRTAAVVAATDPPPIVRGDLLTELPGVLDQAPRDAQVVLIHTAVIAYLPAMARQRFVALVDELRSVRDLVWLSCEGATVLPGMADRLPPDRDPTDFVLARDGDPIALVHPHGRHHRRIDI